MIKIKNKSKCSGCHACVNACPKQCISMIADEEGFLYPVVDRDKCINCGACENVCYNLNPLVSANYPDVYACYNSNEEVRIASSSGGIFTLLAEKIISQGGVVFGASFNEDLGVEHTWTDNKDELYKFRGSKYVQSIIGNTYRQAKDFLQTGRPVLFTGTPCQIYGLLLYLGKNYDNLYTQDIICHGVPSPKVWRSYLKFQEEQHNSKVDKTNPPAFRSKKLGWLNFGVQIHFKENIEYNGPLGKDLYMRAFLNNLSLRPSCYKGNCKNIRRNSDITLADFWGVNNLIPEMFDDKGTSLVFVNTEKGKCLFDDIKEFMVCTKTDIKTAVKHNPMAYSPSFRPMKRKTFMKNMAQYDYEVFKNLCSKRNIFEKVYYRLKRIFIKYLNKLY